MDMPALLRFSYAPRRPRAAYLVLPLIGAAVALAGPFGSYVAMPLPARLAHFTICVTVIGVAVIEGGYRTARAAFQGCWPLWAAWLFDLALLAPSTAVVWLSLSLLAPHELRHVGILTLAWQNALLLAGFRALAVGVALARAPSVAAVEGAPAEDHPLADKLPFALKRARVLALSAEDHYLRVCTDRGEALIHMTLAEAATRLPAGFQIHRSHWINDGTVQALKRDRVELSNGRTLPLSRHRRRAFEDWLATQ